MTAEDPLEFVREAPTSPTARALILALDDELSGRYPEPGATHFRLDPDEVADSSGCFLVVYRGDEPVACGAVRRFTPQTAEIKRMYVVASRRGEGVGRALLSELERRAAQMGYRQIVLETGARQERALKLYRRAGYRPVAPFGEYVESPLSICLGKRL